MLWKMQLGVAINKSERLGSSGFQDFGIRQHVRDPELRHSTLSRSEKISGTAKFKINFRDLEAIRRVDHCREPPLCQSLLTFRLFVGE